MSQPVRRRLHSAMGSSHGVGDAEHGTANSPPAGRWHIFNSRSATRLSFLLITAAHHPVCASGELTACCCLPAEPNLPHTLRMGLCAPLASDTRTAWPCWWSRIWSWDRGCSATACWPAGAVRWLPLQARCQREHTASAQLTVQQWPPAQCPGCLTWCNARVGLLYLVYRLVTFRRWNDEVKHARAPHASLEAASMMKLQEPIRCQHSLTWCPVVRCDVDAGRFIVTFAVLLGVLCIDNFCIWCDAALL